MDRGDGAEAEAGDREKLQEMVRKLEEMDRFLHSVDCPPPTIAELRLCGLIMRHVRFHILLFQMEHSSQALRDHRMSMLCSPLDESPVGENYLDYIENVNEEIFLVLGPFFQCLEFLEDCRKSLAETYFPRGESVDTVSSVKRKFGSLRIAQVVNDMEDSSEVTRNGLEEKKRKRLRPSIIKIISMIPSNQVKNKKTTREQYLFDILQGLEEMRRFHLYAPPSIEDIHYYREIRKRTTSFIMSVDAKVRWQSLFPEKVEGEGKWVTIPQYVYGFPFPMACPIGFRAASLFDELFEIESLLEESSSSFAEIWLSLSEGNGMKDSARNDTKRTDTIMVRRGEEKDAQGSQGCDMKKWVLESRNIDSEMMPPTYCKQVVRTSEVKKMQTRVPYLQDILRMVAKMKSLCLSSPLSIREGRLLSQINKHAYSATWLYNTELATRRSNTKVIASNVSNEGSKKCELASCYSTINVFDLSDAIANDAEMKTREHYLQEIVLLVEEIESSFLYTTPTAGEMRYYRDILVQVSSLSLAWRENQGDRENEIKLDVAMLRNLLKPVLHWELKWSKNVAEKCGKVLPETVIPFGEESGDELKQALDNRANLKSKMMDKLGTLVSGSPQQFEILDQSLLALRKVFNVADTIGYQLCKVNDLMGLLIEIEPSAMLPEVCNIEWNTLLQGENQAAE